jgi:fatty acid desaturase
MIESYRKEVRDKIGFNWAATVLLCLAIAIGFALYCLLTWTFTWWLPAFIVISFMVAHRYGALLEREEQRVKEKDRETVA